MGANNHVYLTAGNRLLLRKARFAFLLPGKPAHFNAQRRKPGAEIVRVLFGQQFGRGHERHLFAMGNRAQGGQSSYQRFTGSHVTLHQAHHRYVERHIAFNFGGNARLCAGGFKRQRGQQLILELITRA